MSNGKNTGIFNSPKSPLLLTAFLLYECLLISVTLTLIYLLFKVNYHVSLASLPSDPFGSILILLVIVAPLWYAIFKTRDFQQITVSDNTISITSWYVLFLQMKQRYAIPKSAIEKIEIHVPSTSMSKSINILRWLWDFFIFFFLMGNRKYSDYYRLIIQYDGKKREISLTPLRLLYNDEYQKLVYILKEGFNAKVVS